MAFKAQVISLEESIDIKNELGESVHSEVNKIKEELRSASDDSSANREEKKTRKKVVKSKKLDMERIIRENGIDLLKWKKFQQVTLVKPIEMVDDSVVNQNLAVPKMLLQKLNALSDYNKSVHMRTIATNLIIDFLENNKDIIQLMESEYKKKGK